MAHSKSAKKRHKKNVARRTVNRAVRSTLKTHVTRVRDAVTAKDFGLADTEARLTATKLDRAAARGVIHKNAASRTKSRLQHLIRSAKTAGAPAKPAPSK
ncbi:MAG: 30S ribosomal protein S20 [Planctomycetes bacterium]|nr:30S ribosomal protein S20 [Planctomycetota bacterium]